MNIFKFFDEAGYTHLRFGGNLISVGLIGDIERSESYTENKDISSYDINLLTNGKYFNKSVHKEKFETEKERDAKLNCLLDKWDKMKKHVELANEFNEMINPILVKLSVKDLYKLQSLYSKIIGVE
jgi:hypothetical protein